MQERPDVAQRFVKAYQKAIAYTWAHPEESGAAVHKLVPEVDAAVAANTIKSIRSLVYNAVSEKDGVGTLEPARLAKTWELVAKAKELKADALDPEQAVDRSLLN